MASNMYQKTTEAIGAVKLATSNSTDKEPLKLAILEQIALNLAALTDIQLQESLSKIRKS